MKMRLAASITLGISMVGAAVAAKVLTPTVFMSQSRQAVQLAQIVPTKFGRWQEETQGVGAVVNPETQAMLKKIYTQTLSRTYVNDQGQRVMLSIAYGGDQRDGMQVHYPEVCYPAQGFQLNSIREDVLTTPYGAIPIKRLETSMAGQRFEPVTYWTTVGDQVVLGGVSKKVAEMRYGVHGLIADGLLFRVSLIDRNSAVSFSIQDTFVRDLLQALSSTDRLRIAGLGTPPR